jgi:tRNA-specific 2-thiouridylase
MLLAVALSGGVDSSVAALRLAGHRLVGATHRIWPGSRCCSADVLRRAERVCARLGIPYLLLDQEEEFRRRVVDDFVQTYLSGRTPNPCVRCNRFVRFGSFFRALQERLEAMGLLDSGEELALATGHYARVRTSDGWFWPRAAIRQAELHAAPGAPRAARLVLPWGKPQERGGGEAEAAAWKPPG